MNRVLSFFADHPMVGLAILFLLSLVFSWKLDDLQVRISAEEMLVQQDEEHAFYDRMRELFGDEQAVLVYLQAPRLLEQKRLKALKEAIGEIEKLPFVDRVESLFSVPWVKTVEGYLDKKPYLDKLPQSPEEEQQVLEEARKNPFLRNVLVSPIRDVMAAAIILKKESWDDETVSHALDEAVAPLQGHYDQVFTIGFPEVRSEIVQRIRQEQARLFPLAIAALLIALFLLLRQLIDILLPLLSAGFSILWTLGFMAMAGIPLNVVTSIIPILLVIVGSTEDIHLLSEFRQGQRQGLATREALKHMARRMGTIVLLTFATTYLGFLSVGLSRIQVLWQFGLVSSTGLLFNFVATVILIPSILSLAGKWQLDGKAKIYGEKSRRIARAYWNFLWRHRKATILLFLVFTLASMSGIPRIHINHNVIDSLGSDSPVRQHIDLVNRDLAGLETFSIVVDSGIEDTFLKVRYLEELAKIQQFIERKGWSRSTTSFADYLSLLNGAFQELDEPVMPESDDAVTELMIFLKYDEVKNYVTKDYSEARILVRHAIYDSEQLKQVLQELQEYIHENLDPGLQAHITGDSVLTLYATQAMIDGQLQSIGLLLVIIILIIGVLFTEIRVGLLATLPNLFPVVVMFGFMGFLGVPLNIGTTMAAAIAIGIAVDDTLHFMLRYNRELKASKSHGIAMYQTIYSEALPVISTSLALIAGFLVFLRSSFPPIEQFGMLGALVLFMALLADFVITPLAISSLRLVTIWDLLSLQLRKQVLEKSPLFEGLHPWQIRQFILSGSIQHYQKGDHVFNQGDESDELYLLLTGKVEACLPLPGKGYERLEQFSPGDVFGDVALLAEIPRKTDAVVVEPSTVLVLNRESIERNLRHRPRITARIFANLAGDMARRLIRMINRQHAQGIKTRRQRS